MLKLYFGNAVTAVTTVMIIALTGFVCYAVINRESIRCWGRLTLLLLVFGLVVCCFAAARDGLDKTIQNKIDGSVAAGIFPLISIPNVVGCIGAAIIIVAAVATPIAKMQDARRIWFFVMSSGVALKILTVEVARIASLF